VEVNADGSRPIESSRESKGLAEAAVLAGASNQNSLTSHALAKFGKTKIIELR
jgi:hypothetical protein